MSLETLCVKTEAEEELVKEEADADMCEDEAGARVKEEVECEDPSALCELYAGHQVKDELVLGPVEYHRPCVLSALPGVDQQSTMSLETLCVKTEAEEELVKEEADADMCEDEAGARVKEEVECEDPSALCELYAGHQVKDELVLGPVEYHRPCVLSALPVAAAPRVSSACGARECSVRLERLPARAQLTHTDQARLGYKKEPQKTNKRQARVLEKKDNNEKRSPVEKLQEASTSQAESPMNTFTAKTDSNATNFKCDLCGKDFDIKSELEKHIQTHELMKKSKGLKESKDFTCKICSCTFESKLLPVEHAKSRHAEVYVTCPELAAAPRVSSACGARECSVRLERLPARAQLTHTDQARLGYKKEPQKTNKRQARVLEKKDNNEKRSPVEKLQEASTSQAESPMNTFTAKTDSNATNFKCDLCGKDFDIKSELEKHIQTHELMKKSKGLKESKDFTCKICSCTFESKLLPVEHAKSRHAEVYVTCPELAAAPRVSSACGARECSVRLERLPARAQLTHTDQARLGYKKEPQKTNKRQARVLEKKDNNEKRSPVEKLQEASTSQAESPMNTFTAKTDSNATNFKCDLCGKDFDIKSELEKHIQTHELMKKSKGLKESKDFTCKICSCTFESKLLLVEHAKSQARVLEKKDNNEKRSPVEKLQEASTSQAESPMNTFTAKTDSNATNFKCDLCGKDFDIKSELEKHIQTHELMKKSKGLKESKDFTCKICSCTFESKLLLVEHAKSRHAEVYVTCPECEYTTCNKGSLQRHLRIHTGERPFKCTQCSSAFAHSSTLKVHLRTHTGDKPHKCTQCSSAFAHSGHLHRHLRTHTGDKPYKCPQCSSAYAQSGHLQRHLRTHTGDKPYRCTQCSSAFARSGHLQIHLRTHTGEKPYKCTQCSSAFAQSTRLIEHLRTHTGEKSFECNICEYKATRSSTLKDHLMSRHSGQKPYGCDTCSYRGATRRHLSHHMKRHHKLA